MLLVTINVFKGLFYVSNAHDTVGCRNFALKLLSAA